MAVKKEYMNLLFAVVTTATYTFLISFFFNEENTVIGKSFFGGVLYIITRNVSVLAGAMALFLRLVRLIKQSSGFLYVLIGSLNVIIGASCIIMFYLNYAAMEWLNKCLLNALVGFLMIVDTFLLDKIFPPGK
jgi:hypothetical protein